jgi:hypothetical protein
MKSSGGSITEGIGQGRITANLEGFTPDMSFNIPDSEAIPLVFDLLEHEGLCLGGSSGINVAGAIRMAREMGPGHTIVTILCDYGNRYQSKLFNPEFLASKDLPVPDWLTKKRATFPSPMRVNSKPMTALFLEDAYLSTVEAQVTAVREDGGILLDQTCFYATSGGQPGDTGFLERENGDRIEIAGTVTGDTKAEIILIPAPDQPVPEVGEKLSSISTGTGATTDAHAHRLSSALGGLPLPDHRRIGQRNRQPH